MDPGSLFLSVWVIMVCLPGDAHCLTYNKCPCPEIPTHHLTVRPQQTCRNLNEAYRYQCVVGYVRKAGTSNRIICKKEAGVVLWTDCSLSCIPDPSIPATQPPKTTVTEEHTDTPHDFIITTTVTPSSSQQTTHDASISASVTAKTESTVPTSSGPVQWTLSDNIQDKTLEVTHESVTVTRAVAWTTSTSTLSLSTVKSNITLHESRTGLDGKKAAVISCVLLVIISAVIGISLCYRRRSINNMPQQTEEEGIPMNH